jgi:TonB family protein
MQWLSCLEKEFNRRKTCQNTHKASIGNTCKHGELQIILVTFEVAEAQMTKAFRLAGVSLMLLLAFSALGAAQSNPGAEPAADKPSSATSEPKTIDGQTVYKVERGITPPRATYSPPPDYSEKARKAKYQGTCILWLVVGADGNPHDIKVTRGLGKGLDEKAIEAVKKWKFEPARKDGQPVAVEINVEVMFRLY